MKNRKSLFLFDFKKTCIFPIIVGSVFTLVFLLFGIYNLFGISENNFLTMWDNYATTLLTVYTVIVLFCIIVRTLGDRNIYKKYCVSSERIYIYKLIEITFLISIYILINLVIGTIRVKYGKIPNANVLPLVFSFQGKVWWYFLFAFSVSMTACLIYSLFTIVYQILLCNDKVIFKVIKTAIIAFIVLLIHIGNKRIVGLNLFESNGFTYTLPLGKFSYDSFNGGFRNLYTIISYYNIPPYNRVLYYALSWNIANTFTLLIGVSFIILTLLSFSYFERKQNYYYFRSKNYEDKVKE